MLDQVHAVVSEGAVLTVINRQRAVANHRVDWCSKTIHIEGEGGNRLPREVAPSAKTTHVCHEGQNMAATKLMPNAGPDKRVDPFHIARVGVCESPFEFDLKGKKFSGTIGTPERIA